MQVRKKATINGALFKKRQYFDQRVVHMRCALQDIFIGIHFWDNVITLCKTIASCLSCVWSVGQNECLF